MRYRSGTWRIIPWDAVKGSQMDVQASPVSIMKDSSMSSVVTFHIACRRIKFASWISISASGHKWRQCVSSEPTPAPWSSESTFMRLVASRLNTMARSEWAHSRDLISQIQLPNGRCNSSLLIQSTLVKSLASTCLIWQIIWERMQVLMIQQWFDARTVISKGLSCLSVDGQSTPS